MKRRTPNTVRIEDTYNVERKAVKMSPIPERRFQPTSSHQKVQNSPIRVNLFQSSNRDRLFGLGSTWCIAPRFIWKHIGIPGEPEIITRRKCITLLLSIVLLLLVLGEQFFLLPSVKMILATIIVLAIALSTDALEDTEIPVSYSVIFP